MKRISSNNYSKIEQLELYLAKVKELRETQFLKKGFKSSFSFHSDFVENTFKIKFFEPNEDDFRSFLTIYRKFISEDSPIYLNKIFNICQINLKNEELKSELKKVRHFWNEEFKGGHIKIHLNQKEYKPKEILDLWINGVYFHDDIDKNKELNNITSDKYFQTVVRQMFFALISETTREILFIESVIKISLENKYFDFS